MKFKTTRTALLNALSACGPAVASKTTKPVLECVRIEAADGKITVQSTDMEIGIVYEIVGAEIQKPGVVAVRPDKLAGIIKDSPTEEVAIETEGDSCRITAGGKFKLATEDHTLFPDVRDTVDDVDAEIPIAAGIVRDVMANVAVFVDQKSENKNFALCGLSAKCDGKRLVFAGTDSRRLAIMESVETEAKCQAIIPVKAISIAAKSLSDDAETVILRIGSNAATFKTDRAMICTKLISGRFPPYDNIIPKKFDFTAELTVADTIRSLRQASVTTEAEATSVEWQFEGEKLTLSSSSSRGESEVEVAVGGNANLSIKLPPDHMLTVLKMASSPTLTMKLISEGRPAVFYPSNGVTCLVMPMVG